jgi:hypothetical protein
MLTRKTKTGWIIGLSAAFAATLIGIALVLSHSVMGTVTSHSTFSIGTGSATLSGATVEKRVTQAFTVGPGHTFALTVPLGKVTVLPAIGSQVQVDADLTVARAVGENDSTLKSQMGLDAASGANSNNVSLKFPNGRLRAATITMYVPKGTDLRIDNSLGEIQVDGGTFQGLNLHDNMGAITVNADVTKNLMLYSNMGAISFTGSLAANSAAVNNMGTITIHDTASQAIAYKLSTNMGQASVDVPSANISEQGNSLSGSTPASGASVTLNCTNNLGSIRLQGE